MKLHLINRERLQSLGSFLVDEFDSLVARIRAAWKVEHTDDGRHGHVHAESVASGRLVFSEIVNVTLTTETVDNFDPGIDTAAILRLNSTLSEVTITGLKVPQDENGVVLDGRVLVLENISQVAGVFRIPHQSTRSFPRNRFDAPRIGGFATVASSTVEVRLYPATTLVLIYNAKKANWIVHSQSNDSYIGHGELGSSQNNYQPSLSWRALRTMRIAATSSDLTISGFLSTNIPSTERKTIVNDGLFTIAILHANTNSDEANRVYCPGGVRYLLHPRESVELQRVGSGGWRIVEKADQWTDVTHDAANFTATTGTWMVESGDQFTYAYQIDGNKMTVDFHIATSSVSSATPDLKIAIPAGRVSARAMHNQIFVNDNGTRGSGFAQVTAGGATIQLFLNSLANWAASTNATGVSGQITFMVRDDCAAISELHTDVEHGDQVHQDADHSDAHSDSPAHGDSHSDQAHQDASHLDVPFQDVHDDVAFQDDHDDVAHEDHTDDVTPHEDAHEDLHVDSPTGGPGGGHADVHDDEHSDHTDQSHSDQSHADHDDDVAHQDHDDDVTHQDSSHSDQAHSDSHSDTAPHSDTHADQGHGDQLHQDSEHQDVGYHCDTDHADQ